MEKTSFAPMTLEEMEAAWGGPLPEVESIYYEMAKDFVKGRPELAPYVLKKYFTLDEAEIVMQLPGSAEDVAQKLGRDPAEVEEKLEKMYKVCKVIKNSNGYIRHTTIPMWRNTMFIQTNDPSVCDQQGARLFNAWDATLRYGDKIAGGRDAGVMRIVPKWESIKNIPGVMPCESAPQLLRDMYDNVRFKICACRAVTSYAETGKPYQQKCRTGINDTDVKHGICIGTSKTDEYYERLGCAYHPTREELEEHIKYLEETPAYYMMNNDRVLSAGLCSCCDDCDCGVRRPYERGDEDFYVKSRFLATVAHPDKCVGCGKCERVCHFKKSIRVVDGKAVVDNDRCHGCGVCVTKCPTSALKMKLIRPASHIPEVAVTDAGWQLDTNTFK